MDGWQSVAGQLAQIGLPALGGLFGGPLGGAIGGLVGKGVAAALGVEPTPQAVSQAIQADPNGAAVKLAQIESETKAKADELADIQSARATTVQLAQAGSSIAWGSSVVSVIVTLGFFGIMAGLFFIRSEMPQSVFQLLSVMLGILATAFASVVQYWTGSSESSRRNGDAIRDVARSAVTPSPGQVAQTVANAVKR
jgi:hypothetical protein